MPIESIQAQRPSFPHDLRVLLCDTEEAARKEALQLLTSCKYAVTECASAEECASLAAAGEFDIIIIDVSCFSDETAAQQSAAIFALGTPCALTFTAPACPKVHALTAGCVDVLEKPLVLTRCSTLWMHLVRRFLAASGQSGTPAHLSPSSPPARANGFQRSNSCFPALGTAGTSSQPGTGRRSEQRQAARFARQATAALPSTSMQGVTMQTGPPAVDSNTAGRGTSPAPMQIDATGTQPVAAAGTAAAAGASAAKAAANADGDSTNRVTADRASSGDTVAAAVTAAVTAAVCGAGGESVSLSVSNSEGNRPSSTTDFVTTSQDVESGTPQATVAQPGCSSLSALARLDSTQVAGLTSGLSHLSVQTPLPTATAAMADAVLAACGEDNPMSLTEGLDEALAELSALEAAAAAAAASAAGTSAHGGGMGDRQHSSGSPGSKDSLPDMASLLDADLLNLLPTTDTTTATGAQQPSETAGVAKGHYAGRLPDTCDHANGMVWGIPTNPLNIIPRMGPTANPFAGMAGTMAGGMGMMAGAMGMPPPGMPGGLPNPMAAGMNPLMAGGMAGPMGMAGMGPMGGPMGMSNHMGMPGMPGMPGMAGANPYMPQPTPPLPPLPTPPFPGAAPWPGGGMPGAMPGMPGAMSGMPGGMPGMTGFGGFPPLPTPPGMVGGDPMMAMAMQQASAAAAAAAAAAMGGAPPMPSAAPQIPDVTAGVAAVNTGSLADVTMSAGMIPTPVQCATPVPHMPQSAPAGGARAAQRRSAGGSARRNGGGGANQFRQQTQQHQHHGAAQFGSLSTQQGAMSGVVMDGDSGRLPRIQSAGALLIDSFNGLLDDTLTNSLVGNGHTELDSFGTDTLPTNDPSLDPLDPSLLLLNDPTNPTTTVGGLDSNGQVTATGAGVTGNQFTGQGDLWLLGEGGNGNNGPTAAVSGGDNASGCNGDGFNGSASQPLGLRLNKSASLLDLIAQTLSEGQAGTHSGDRTSNGRTNGQQLAETSSLQEPFSSMSMVVDSGNGAAAVPGQQGDAGQVGMSKAVSSGGGNGKSTPRSNSARSGSDSGVTGKQTQLAGKAGAASAAVATTAVSPTRASTRSRRPPAALLS